MFSELYLIPWFSLAVSCHRNTIATRHGNRNKYKRWKYKVNYIYVVKRKSNLTYNSWRLRRMKRKLTFQQPVLDERDVPANLLESWFDLCNHPKTLSVSVSVTRRSPLAFWAQISWKVNNSYKRSPLTQMNCLSTQQKNHVPQV